MTVEAAPGPAMTRTGPKGVWAWVTTVDHKRIGLMYAVSALFFFLTGGLEALLIRLQLAQANGTILSADAYNQLFTMHGLTMVFLVVMPIAAGFTNYFLPIMIGARDVAFPRLNAFSFWLFLFSGIFLASSFFLGGAPDGAWTGYSPLATQVKEYIRMDFFALGAQMLGIASLAAAVNFITTVFTMRAPGMSLLRMPVFVWMALVVQFLLLFSLPLIGIGLFQLYFDRNLGTVFYAAAAGADPLLWQHLFWLFGHPEVYVLILPAMGIVSDILPTFSRKPLFGYSFVVFAGIAIGFMGFGVWSHHMFTAGMGPLAEVGFGLATMLIAIPTGIKVFNWIGTMWGGDVRFDTPMLFSVGFIAMFVIGGLSGVTHAMVPSDTQQHDSYYVVAHFHYVLFGGAIFGYVAGVYYWFGKWTGRMMNEKIGKWHFWIMLLGFNLTFAPMHFLGLNGMPRRTYRYGEGLGFDTWNLVSTIGAFVIAIAVLVFIYNLVWSYFKGDVAGNDPWDGRTLEWSTPSPTPLYNFDVVPEVHGLDDWWHRKYDEDDEGRLVLREDQPEPAVLLEDASHIHLPSDSFYPVLTAFGIVIIGYGLLYVPVGFWFAGLGALVTLWGFFGWSLEPVAKETH
ncbi:MAG: cytochrome c oxidase subunit I [Actinobacteria bacterium]|nr:cytochrome c oxidase subunit I [Actinomycetota bacterium]